MERSRWEANRITRPVIWSDHSGSAGDAISPSPSTPSPGAGITEPVEKPREVFVVRVIAAGSACAMPGSSGVLPVAVCVEDIYCDAWWSAASVSASLIVSKMRFTIAFNLRVDLLDTCCDTLS